MKPAKHRSRALAPWVLAWTLCLACAGSSPRPSILLVVLDTTRVDAVSAYGRVERTTPHIDALATSGPRYAQAYSQSNWTVPSHASLFVGLLPSQHGAVSFTTPLDQSFLTLAERPTDRPFFLFLNIMDAHSPYEVRTANPHLPAGATFQEARAISQRARDHLCQTPDRSREMEILRALYLDGVSAADQKLGRVLEVLSHAGADKNPIIVVTSDHGEHLGEQRRFLHDIGVRQPLIHIPLIVHGLPEVPPAVIDAPVQLLDLLPSVLDWVGMDPVTELPGRRLPTRPSGEHEPRIIFSEYMDPLREETPQFLRQGIARTRHACGPATKVSGDARSALRWPYKLVWYARHANELYDLRADPFEQRAAAAASTRLVAELQAALPSPWSPPPERASDTPRPPPDPVFLEALRALGYIDDPEAREAATHGAGEK